jgi:hypothetical protein
MNKVLIVFAIFITLYVVVGLEEGDKCGGGWTSPTISLSDCLLRQHRLEARH